MKAPTYKQEHVTVPLVLPRWLWSEVQRKARLEDKPTRTIVKNAIRKHLKTERTKERDP